MLSIVAEISGLCVLVDLLSGKFVLTVDSILFIDWLSFMKSPNCSIFFTSLCCLLGLSVLRVVVICATWYFLLRGVNSSLDEEYKGRSNK